MNPLSQIVFLAFTDLRRQLGSPHSAISFVGSIVFVGILFWLLIGFAIDHFLNAAFLMMPILILAPATASITSDREAGYASILFTYPITATRYYAAKFLAFHLLIGVYFLILTPFLAIILLYGGIGWLGDITKFAGWALLETSFVTALGLFLSASFGRRAAVASASLGFGLALVFVIGPWYTPYYVMALPPETASLFLRFLHYSPMMAALDGSGTGLLVADNPLPSFLATISVVAVLVALGLLVYRRFQSAEGWEVGRVRAAAIVALGIVLLFAVPMIPGVSYVVLPQSFGTSNCVQTSTLEYCVGFQTVSPNGSLEYPSLGSPIQAQVAFSLNNEHPAPVTVESITLSWSARFFSFNVTHAEFGPVEVPADPGPNETSSVSFRMNVTALPVRVSSLRSYEGFPSFAPIPTELTVDGIRFRFNNAMSVSGPTYNPDIVWGVVGLEAALVLGRRLTRRPRKA
ncbi:MAG: ABC transporter permease [Thermoplasmata archaeon]